MNAKITVFVICAETIIYLLLYNFHDCTFKNQLFKNTCLRKPPKRLQDVHFLHFASTQSHLAI